MHAVGGKDAGRHALEVLALEARIARDGNGGVVIVGVQVVGHALGCLGNHVDVHAVGAHAERAAQARSAKLERAIEGVVERILIASADKGVKLGLEVWLGDVVLPKLDGFLHACVHGSPLASRRTNTRGAPRLSTNKHEQCTLDSIRDGAARSAHADERLCGAVSGWAGAARRARPAHVSWSQWFSRRVGAAWRADWRAGHGRKVSRWSLSQRVPRASSLCWQESCTRLAPRECARLWARSRSREALRTPIAAVCGLAWRQT